MRWRRLITHRRQLKEGHRVLKNANRSPKAVKEVRREQRRPIGTPKAIKNGRRVLKKANHSPTAVKNGRREQRGPLCSQMGIKKAAVCRRGRFAH